MKKHWKTLAATVGLCAACTMPAFADTTTSIYYNDQLLNTTEPVVNVNGRTLVAFRDLFDCFDAEVEWSDEFRMAKASYGKNTVYLFPDTGVAQLNGVPQELAVGPQIINDRIYLPLRFVAQSLGATVDYTKDRATDHGTIQIKSINHVENYVSEENRVTKILREVMPLEEENVQYNYFVDANGNLVELVSRESGLTVNVIDIHQGEVRSKHYSTKGVYPAIDKLEPISNAYRAVISDKPAATYVGVGSPIEGSYRNTFDSQYGDLYLYDSAETEQVITINSRSNEASGLLEQNNTGFVLDYRARSTVFKNSDYVTTKNGQYHGYLMDNYFTILENNGKLNYDGMIDRNYGNHKLFTWNNKFIVTSTSVDTKRPELYVTVYDVNGAMINSMRNISQFHKLEINGQFYDYNRVKIEDYLQDENKLYFLLHTGWDRFVVVYDIKTNENHLEMLDNLEYSYDKFIYTDKGVRLFYADEDYYYLREVE